MRYNHHYEDTQMNAIEVQGLRKTYANLFGRKRIRALDGVDIEVPIGIAFGLIGLNGAGKTTFIKTLLDIVQPEAGEIRVFGAHPESPETRRRIGYLPERLHMPPVWTARSFLKSIARLKCIHGPDDAIEMHLDQVGLTTAAHQRIGTFSKGMMRRLGLAVALLGSPDLLVLDEPTDGIDPLGQRDVRRLLEAERNRGATIFINSHLLTETEHFCDRVGILHHGRLIRQGTVSELCKGSNRWLVRFTPHADTEMFTKHGFIKANGANEWWFESSNLESLNRAIDRARASGALLDGLRPDFKELEEILAETVEKNP